jgi:glycosyltransferase involved in cell wall biosynthesis
MSKSILFVGNFFSTLPGAWSVSEELCRRAGEAGWTTVAASHHHGRLRRITDMVWTAIRRRSEYTVAQVDVFSGAAFVWAEAVTTVLRQLGKPMVLVLRGGNLPAFAQAHPSRVRRVLDRAEAVLVPSPYLEEAMRPFRRDLVVLPNPIDVDRYPWRVRDHATPRLIWLRAFHAIYNPSLAPRVVALLAQRFPDIALTMIGRDKQDGSLQETQRVAEELGVAGRMLYPGGVAKDDVGHWLDGADIFLNTTDIDNTPVSVLEALASGLCVVSTNVGGIPFLLRDGVDALLVPPASPEAMAAAVARILDDRVLAARLSRAGHATAGKYTWSTIFPAWEQVVTAAADRRGAR